MTGLIITGALSMGYAVSALFFLKFWTSTRDRLFALFAAAFALLALQRLLLAYADPASAWQFYLVRLLAFLLIIVAIVDKNRSGT